MSFAATTAPSNAGLPAATFAKLSPHDYLLSSLTIDADTATGGTRLNGRQPGQARPLHVNASSLKHAHGSALVRIGDTTVLCGVRGETLLTSSIPNYREPSTQAYDATRESTELADYDLLVPNIELATGSAPKFLPGAPPTTLAQTLTTRAYTLLRGNARLVDPEDLRIWYAKPVESYDEEGGGDEAGDSDMDREEPTGERVVMAYWVLYIDVLFLSYDGNPFDVAWAAILAALRDTKLPQAYWDPDREMVLCSRHEPPRPLSIRGLPIACTASVFVGREDRKGEKVWILADPDRYEEDVCKEELTVVLDRSGDAGETTILSISKHGGTVIAPEALAEFVERSDKRWNEFHAVMNR